MQETEYSSEPIKEEKVVQYHVISFDQFNQLSKEGKKSLVGNIVRARDGKVYQIAKNGNIIRMVNPPSFDPIEQDRLAKKHHIQEFEQIKQQQQMTQEIA